MSRSVPIDDLIEALIDYRGKTPPKTDSGVPLITAKVIKGGRILGEPREYISEVTYESWMKRGLPATGDILITTEAPLGEVAQVGLDSRIALAQRVILLRPDPNKVAPQFLFHYLRSPLARASLERRASGTTVSGIRQPELRAVEVRLLEREAQEVVGEILDSIDELIENSRQRVAVLDEMARAIYREWFVHFRFPGHEDAAFVDSHLGPIPEGWVATELGNVASVNAATRRPMDAEVVKYLDISCLGDRTIEPPSAVIGAEAPGRARRVVEAGDVVWSMVRPNRRAHALLVEPGTDWIASTGLAVLSPVGVAAELLFETVSAGEFSDYLVSQEGGAAYPAVKPKDFERAPFLRPAAEVEALFTEAVAPIHRLIWILRAESERLCCVRDLLLPKLVTGEIDVSSLDLDAMVEASVA